MTRGHERNTQKMSSNRATSTAGSQSQLPPDGQSKTNRDQNFAGTPVDNVVLGAFQSVF